MVLGQNLSQIRSNVLKKVKNLALSIIFFHILHEEYILKQEVVVVQTPEWKCKASIARNVTLSHVKIDFLFSVNMHIKKNLGHLFILYSIFSAFIYFIWIFFVFLKIIFVLSLTLYII